MFRIGDALPFFSRYSAANEVVGLARKTASTIVTAESLTGGMIGAALTSIPGSSRSYWGGFTVYSPDAKTRLLGVSSRILQEYGTVSRETAEAMARGALDVSGADIAVAVTGVAGPGGGTDGIPVGTVWIALARKASPGRDGVARAPEVSAERCLFAGSRRRVRAATALRALRLLAAQLDR